MSEASRLGKITRFQFAESNTQWRRMTVDRAKFLQPYSALSIIRYTNEAPDADTLNNGEYIETAAGQSARFAAPGEWWFNIPVATGARASFKLYDYVFTEAYGGVPLGGPSSLDTLTGAVTWGTHSSVAVGLASVTALAANASRRAMLFTNKSTGGQVITLNLAGAAAVAGEGAVLVPNQTLIWNPLDIPSRGIITAIASAAAGSLGVAEAT